MQTNGHQYSKATRLTCNAAAIIHNCRQHQHTHTHTLTQSHTSSPKCPCTTYMALLQHLLIVLTSADTYKFNNNNNKYNLLILINFAITISSKVQLNYLACARV